MSGFADRVVEVLCDLGPEARPRWLTSSGLLVDDRHVLTAAHAVVPGAAVTVRGADKVEHAATVKVHGEAGGVDLAILETAGGRRLTRLAWGAVDRDGAEIVAGCRGLGYPVFQQVPGPDGRPVRDTAQLDGVIPTGDRRVSELLTLRVTSTPRPLPPQEEALGRSQWSGVSGTVIVTADDVMVGVVTEHHPRAGDAAVTLTPITAIDRLADAPQWWDILGRRHEKLPRRRRSAYHAIVDEIVARTPALVDREAELGELRAFATGREAYRFLIGTPWAGKTALVAHLAADPPDGVDCVAYLLQRRALDATGSRFLAAVTGQLAAVLDEEPPENPDAANLADLWRRAADRAERVDRHLLLVVDGLDEDLRPAGERSVASLLPARAGGFTHVLVTARRDQLPEDLDVDHPLWNVTPVRMEQVVEAARVEQRAVFDLDALLREPDARKVIGLMSAAAGPLTTPELAELGELDPFVVAAIVEKQAARVLDGGAGGWRFGHQTLLDACRDTIFGPQLAPYVTTVDTWAGRHASAGWPATTPPYLLAHYPWALLARRDDTRFAELTGDPRWLDTAVTARGVDAVLAPLRAAPTPGPALRLLETQAHFLRTRKGVPVAGQLALAAAFAGSDDPRWATAAGERCGLAADWTSGRASRSLVRSFDTGSRQVWSAVFVTDTTVLTGDDDGRVRLWELDGGRYTDVGRHASGVHRMGVWNGTAVSCGNDQTVRLWSLDGGPERELVRGLGHTWAVAWSPDGRKIATGGRDRVVRLWDVATGADELVGTHDDQVRVLVFSPDGTMIVTGGRDDTIRVWWPATGAGRILGRNEPGKWIEALAVTPDGQTVITGSYHGVVKAWPLDGGQPRTIGRHEGQVWAAAVSPDGTFAVTGGGDGCVRLWPLAPGVTERVLGRHGEPVRCVSVNPAGTLVVSSAADGNVHLWDLSSSGDAVPVRQSLTAVAVDPAGQVYTGSLAGEVRRLADGLPGAPVGVRALAVAGGRVFALAEDGRLLVDGTEFGRQVGARSLASFADVVVVAGGAESVSLWPIGGSGGLPVRRVDAGRQIQVVAAAADGTILAGYASGSLSLVQPWSAVEQLLPPDLHPPVWSVAATVAGGSFLGASGDLQGAVRLWPGGEVFATLDGPVAGLGFAADGRVLLGAGTEGLTAWSVADGRVLVRVRTEPLTGLAVAGTTAATLSDQLGVTRWRLRL
ncbi:NACHT and WD repeat domain-containing protein [Hamadaea tsunoensis]|uniref:NACHT and WD repeat domain-containing protein n=1 Tax=Hamadaea tsunoensis TaxID=53368 RepID=UPI000425D134|nr:hypothetical protein [Hamadaea tsunoensis]